NLLFHLSAAGQEETWLFYLEGQPGISDEAGLPRLHAAPIPLHAGLRATSVKIATGISLPRRIRRLRLDAMLFPQGPGAEAVCAIPRKSPCPLIVVVHDLIPLLFPEHYPQFADSALYQAQCQLLTSAAAIIADSESTKASVCSHLGVKEESVRVVYPGVDSIFSPLDDVDELSRVWSEFGISSPYFLTIGGYDWRKNLRTTLRAFAGMREQSRADYGLVVVESRLNCSEETRGLIEQLGISDQVIFTGAVSDEHLRALYSGAQALIFPTFYEGFGLPVLEAMACGIPVICSRAGALREVGSDVPLCVEPEDAEELTAQMLRVAQEPELCRELSAQGIARASQFSWHTAALEILSLCRQVAGIPESVMV
ncbi:MAG: glycosyltransferase, partial [Armatimonadetes bacterium]|nr:glycosyltransferase [Armatimonadota bacterium]NIO76208.1 glycosyltransferase [Armatimonadota bacterium]NIO98874.1 glycosyltransferase [Armatimonadota bacterium]